MEKFTKITVGFVTQSYEKNAAGKFICTGQEFIAGDQVDYEDANGNAVTPPEHDYQPFNMSLLSGANIATQSGKLLIECFVFEQCSDVPRKKLPVNIMAELGKLWVQPVGYGDKTSADGHGWPIGLEIWQGRLRLIIFDDINTEEPKIIDLENAAEDNRVD